MCGVGHAVGEYIGRGKGEIYPDELDGDDKLRRDVMMQMSLLRKS